MWDARSRGIKNFREEARVEEGWSLDYHISVDCMKESSKATLQRKQALRLNNTTHK